MKKNTILITILSTIQICLWSGEVPLKIFDTQTSFGFNRGEYNVSIGMYDQGGINMSAGVGINDRICLGVIEYVDGLIGKGKNKWNIPGVYFKVNILNFAPNRINTSLSYNQLYNGSFSEYDDKSYGAVATVSKGFYILAAEPHVISGGAYFPILPNYARHPREISLFANFILSLGNHFKLGMEIEDINFKKKELKKHRFIWNSLGRFNFNENVYVEFAFQVTDKRIYNNPDKEYKLVTARNLSLGYTGFF